MTEDIFYCLGTSEGILKQLCGRSQIPLYSTNLLKIEEIASSMVKHLSGQLIMLTPEEAAKDLSTLCTRPNAKP